MSDGDDAQNEALLLTFLQSNDVACPLCGYNLRGLATPRCPECGREVKLTVGIVQPYMTPWIALLAMMGASAGIGVAVAISLLKDGWPNWTRRDLAWILSAAYIYFLAAIPLILATIIWRRLLMRQPKWAQWTLFALATVSGIAMLAVVTLSD